MLLALTGTAAFIFMVIYIMLVLFPQIFYLLTLRRTLLLISPGNRHMQPDRVWLSLIPLFGIVWQFFIVARMADSLAAELSDRNIAHMEHRPGYQMGIAYCILFSCIIIPGIGLLAGLGGVVTWVLYWLKINEYKNTLLDNPPTTITI
jgi:hypothetical protein